MFLIRATQIFIQITINLLNLADLQFHGMIQLNSIQLKSIFKKVSYDLVFLYRDFTTDK